MSNNIHHHAIIGPVAWDIACKYGVKFIDCHKMAKEDAYEIKWECVFQSTAGNFIISLKDSELSKHGKLSITEILDTKMGEQYPELAL